jgi:hypothetical protein
MNDKLSNSRIEQQTNYLPKAPYSQLSNFMSFIYRKPYQGTIDLPDLASGLKLEIDDLFFEKINRKNFLTLTKVHMRHHKQIITKYTIAILER